MRTVGFISVLGSRVRGIEVEGCVGVRVVRAGARG